MKKGVKVFFTLGLVLVVMTIAGCNQSEKNKSVDASAKSEAATGEKTSAGLDAGMVDTSAFKTDKDEYLIGFSNISVVNTYRVQMVHELKAYADTLDNVTLITTDAGGDSAKQVSDIQDLLAQDVDALLIAPGSATATNMVTRQAIEDGIPVVVFNAQVEGDDAFTSFVGSNSVEFGYAMGKWLVNELGGEGKIIVLDGMAGNAINEQREQGLMMAIEELPDNGDKIEILATYYADWAYDKGKQSTELALAAYPEIDGVWSQGGAMTQGAIEAFQAANRDLVPMTGEDNNGFLKLWKANVDNGFRSISASEPTWMGTVALDTALKALKGVPVQKINFLPIPTITDADLDQYVRTEYSDSYWCNSKLSKEVADKFYLE